MRVWAPVPFGVRRFLVRALPAAMLWLCAAGAFADSPCTDPGLLPPLPSALPAGLDRKVAEEFQECVAVLARLSAPLNPTDALNDGRPLMRDALSRARRLREHWPDHPVGSAVAGYVQFRLGNYHGALRAYTQAARPGSDAAWATWRAYAQDCLGRLESWDLWPPDPALPASTPPALPGKLSPSWTSAREALSLRSGADEAQLEKLRPFVMQVRKAAPQPAAALLEALFDLRTDQYASALPRVQLAVEASAKLPETDPWRTCAVQWQAALARWHTLEAHRPRLGGVLPNHWAYRSQSGVNVTVEGDTVVLSGRATVAGDAENPNLRLVLDHLFGTKEFEEVSLRVGPVDDAGVHSDSSTLGLELGLGRLPVMPGFIEAVGVFLEKGTIRVRSDPGKHAERPVVGTLGGQPGRRDVAVRIVRSDGPKGTIAMEVAGREVFRGDVSTHKARRGVMALHVSAWTGEGEECAWRLSDLRVLRTTDAGWLSPPSPWTWPWLAR